MASRKTDSSHTSDILNVSSSIFESHVKTPAYKESKRKSNEKQKDVQKKLQRIERTKRYQQKLKERAKRIKKSKRKTENGSENPETTINKLKGNDKLKRNQSQFYIRQREEFHRNLSAKKDFICQKKRLQSKAFITRERILKNQEKYDKNEYRLVPLKDIKVEKPTQIPTINGSEKEIEGSIFRSNKSKHDKKHPTEQNQNTVKDAQVKKIPTVKLKSKKTNKKHHSHKKKKDKKKREKNKEKQEPMLPSVVPIEVVPCMNTNSNNDPMKLGTGSSVASLDKPSETSIENSITKTKPNQHSILQGSDDIVLEERLRLGRDMLHKFFGLH